MPAQGHRLYVKAKHLSYQRSKHHIQPNTSLVKVEGCDSKEDAQFYLGKRICFVYKCNKPIRGSKIRVIWGTVSRVHGNSGVVRARFVHNLPPKTFGASLRVMLYPSNI
ncbi:60S ribosomal protein L35A [Schizosaccharomyces osmophilus]|uniref:60S ribosomal protein L35A n=1 Tax=Schizosaccharomyces osmophilus TaxID=2545709 RepID=A0AAE9WC74_9SCHI|nr:60S ribosomal protein L35A [Schizosaccharomyces osmophilus]WBW73545.1 60S ribosomal protein L35A [Schizosaccharomyces osmophilus]